MQQYVGAHMVMCGLSADLCNVSAIVEVFVSTCTGKLRNSLGNVSYPCHVPYKIEICQNIFLHIPTYMLLHLITAKIISSTPWSTASHTVNYFQRLLYNL